MGRIERGLVELRAIEVSAAVLYAVGCV
jgi:hypothetical protein